MEERKNSTWKLILLITTINMICPLSIDMYLPAMPTMDEYFMTTNALVNITLSCFFLTMAIGQLFFGPLSDKYGRKPLLLVGITIYLLASVSCALSLNIYHLIISRIFQAIGAGCMVSVSIAILKDSFEGKVRDNVLAIAQSISVIAPVVAPLIGAFIIKYASWQWTFWALAIIAVLCFTLIVNIKETMAQSDKFEGSVFASIGRLAVVAQNKSLIFFLLMIATLAVPFFAYLALSSHIYMEHFAVSEEVYGIFFAITSALMVLGPVIFIRINGRVKPKIITAGTLSIMALSGVAILLFGQKSPLIFLFTLLPFTIIQSAFRPFSTSILLNQQDHDTGSVSSLINFVNSTFGSLGTFLAPIFIGHLIVPGLGIILICSVVIAATGWMLILQSGLKIKGLTTDAHAEKETPAEIPA